jgi:hypothetical protein
MRAATLISIAVVRFGFRGFFDSSGRGNRRALASGVVVL